jgi:hypothetical protein
MSPRPLFTMFEEEEARPPARVIPWPSIAAASAHLRRRGHLNAVSTRAASPAVLGRVTPLHPTTGTRRR